MNEANNPVWVQNLIGYIDGQFPADERWREVFRSNLLKISSATVLLPREPTPEMYRAMHEAMFEEPYDASNMPMLGAGYDAAIAKAPVGLMISKPTAS